MYNNNEMKWNENIEKNKSMPIQKGVIKTKLWATIVVAIDVVVVVVDNSLSTIIQREWRRKKKEFDCNKWKM